MLTRRTLLQAMSFAPYISWNQGVTSMQETARPFPWQSTEIRIQPLAPYNRNAIEFAKYALQEVYALKVIINDPIPVPESARVPPRGRYYVNRLIELLGQELTLGVTDVDICQPFDHPGRGHIPDFGIIGAAHFTGNAGVISTKRIRQTSWIAKVTIHEVGHIRGLPECDTEGCQMMDVRGDGDKYEIMQYGWFCPKHYT